MSTILLKRRGIALALALFLAALATLALVSYLRGLEDRAYAGVRTVQAFVAKADIPAQTSVAEALESGLIERTKIPQKVLAAGAIHSLSEIDGMYATVAILEGEQILAARFAQTIATTTLLPIPKGKQAITVQANVPNSVGGFVQPGDSVSLIAKLDSAAETGQSTEAAVARFLIQNVSVLAVNDAVQGVRKQTQDGEEEGDIQQDQALLLTIAVSPGDAEKVAFAVLEGEVYFTLVESGASAAKTNGRTAENIFR